jgi:predicted RNA-binding Zn-ribbon protein involved in translation (DUF1610 family)
MLKLRSESDLHKLGLGIDINDPTKVVPFSPAIREDVLRCPKCGRQVNSLRCGHCGTLATTKLPMIRNLQVQQFFHNDPLAVAVSILRHRFSLIANPVAQSWAWPDSLALGNPPSTKPVTTIAPFSPIS